MFNTCITVEKLIEELQKIPDKSKWVWANGAGLITKVDNCPEYLDPEEADKEDQGTCISLLIN